MDDLAITFHTDGNRFLYEQIYEYIVEEIRAGKLPEGEKLPSTRSLAVHLQISRSTAEQAYGQLLAEGYIESRPYRGYYVTGAEGILCLPGRNDCGRKWEEAKTKSYRIDFSPNAVDTEGFPFATWKTIQRRILSDSRMQMFETGHPQGEDDLRKIIARYLHASRGVQCEASQIIIGAGNDYLLMLLEKILGPDRRIAMENPSYRRAFQIFASCGYQVEALSMDEGGMKMQELRSGRADTAYLMPAHQFPMGITMPVRRRTELLAWAEEARNRYLIEDDYDSEFRYKGRPIPALQSLDRSGKVIYIGTFSKAIAPAIRISYMVLPPRLLEQYREKAAFFSATVSRIDQKTLCTFLEEGYFGRHLNKMRKLYKNKHDLLLQQLKPYRDRFDISGENAGLHLLLHAKDQRETKELLYRAEKAGIRIYPVTGYGILKELPEWEKNTLILGYAGLSGEQIMEGIDEMLGRN